MIHALPGMGANHLMFPHPWPTLPDFVAHDWPPYHNEQTLADLAHSVAEAYAIRDGDILIGASLGGMVACEIAKIRRLSALYLVGSAVSKSEINTLLTLLRPLINIAPINWLQYSAGKLPSDLTQMFTHTDPAFIRAMCAAICQWPGAPSLTTPIHRLHGQHDHIIPPPPKPHLLLNAGHLLALTHPHPCTAYIRQTL